MIKGYLKINVYNDSVANPIQNAIVTILKNGEEISKTTTNSSGQTEIISLETVSKNYSMEEQDAIKPYETYDLEIKALGMNTTLIKEIPIFEDITTIQDVYLTSIDTLTGTKTIDIPPNTLWGNYPPSIEESSLDNESNITPYILKNVVIPQNIIVHDGNPNDSTAPNYTVPFIDYIKNVASNEIYSTWPKETIKANVLAIISFTLNRIYTEWYQSRGYNFTITSTTTYDQKYTRNGPIYSSISQIVDEIFTNYIKVGYRMEPLLAHYKANTNESGYLSQWGSKDLGDQGYSALEILKYYYGNDVNIYTAPVSTTYPYSFTTTLKENDCNIDVYILQNALNYIRGSYPAIPIINKPSGYFDNTTTNAVKAFQKIFSLSQTGQVNYETWYKISFILTAVKDLTKNLFS